MPNEPCGLCEGLARYRCEGCSGDGEVVHECHERGCRQSHTAECPSCAGEGWCACDECHGAGMILRLRLGDVLCPVCEGEGGLGRGRASCAAVATACMICGGGGLLQSAEGAP